MRVISIGHDKWWVHGNNDQEPFRNVSRKIDFDVSNAYNNNLLEIYFSWSVNHYFLLWIEEGIFEIFYISSLFVWKKIVKKIVEKIFFS